MGATVSTVGELFSEFLGASAINGIPHIATAKHILQRLFWIFASVGGLAMLIFHTYILTKEYLQYDTVTNFASINNRTLNFPQITFCSANPVKVSGSKNGPSQFLQELYYYWDSFDFDGKTELPLGSKNDGYDANGEYYYEYNYDDNSDNTTNATNIGPDLTTEFLLKKSRLTDFSDIQGLVQLRRTDVDALGFSKEELLVDCSWDARKDCGKDDFFKTYSRTYGFCYTWNSPFNNSGHEIVTVPKTRRKISRQFGANFGLRMTFNIHPHEYVSVLSPSYGMRMFLSNFGSFPNTNGNSIDIPNGISTEIVLNIQEIERLKAPYRSRCIRDYPEELRRFLVLPNQDYDMQACMLACAYKHTADVCLCTQDLNLNPNKTGAVGCNSEESVAGNTTDLVSDCVKKVARRLVTSESSRAYLSCEQCLPECKSKLYFYRIYQTQWPSNSYITFMKAREKWKEMLAERNKTEGEGDWARRNLANVHIYFKDQSYDAIEEHPPKTIANLIAEWGGIAGLYLGISLMAAFELFELVYLLIAFTCCPGRECHFQVGPAEERALTTRNVSLILGASVPRTPPEVIRPKGVI